MILAAGLTPAWQQTATFARFQPGEVNRAESVHWCASGKVLNVGAALHRLGANTRTLSFAGGTTGRLLREEFDSRGVSTHWIETQTPTRVCTTILDRHSGAMTELVENALPVTAAELTNFTQAFVIEAAQAEWVILTGSLPQQTPAEFYSRLMQTTSARVLLDVRGGELQACLPLKPFLVKPNREELGQTVGLQLETDADLLAAMRAVCDAGAQRIVVSQGPNELWFLNAEGLFRLRPPQVNCVNPIACGDCLAAGIATALAEGRGELDALRFGMAAAADNAGQLLPAEIDRRRTEELMPSIEVLAAP